MKGIPKSLAAALLLCAAMPVSAGEMPWRLERAGVTAFAARQGDPDFRVPLTVTSDDMALLSWEPAPEVDGVGLLHYRSGKAGREAVMTIYRAALVDLEAERFLGDMLWKVVNASGRVENRTERIWLDDALFIRDEMFGSGVIRLKPPYYDDYGVEVKRFQSVPALRNTEDLYDFMVEEIETRLTPWPEFAGHMSVVTWSCGTGCTDGALVDLYDGRVYPFPFAAHRRPEQEVPVISYQANSRLMVVRGLLDEAEAGTFFYVWDGLSLVRLED